MLPGFRALQLKHARTRLLFSRAARRAKDRPIAFVDQSGAPVLVTRACRAGGAWRVSWFGLDLEPHGHAEARTHREAVDLARQYGALAESARPR